MSVYHVPGILGRVVHSACPADLSGHCWCLHLTIWAPMLKSWEGDVWLQQLTLKSTWHLVSQVPGGSLSSVWTAVLSIRGSLAGPVCECPSIHTSQITRLLSRSSGLTLFFTKTTRRVKAVKFIPRFAGIYWIIWHKDKDRYVGSQCRHSERELDVWRTSTAERHVSVL